MQKPYEECPSFDKCSSNECPLDPELKQREILKEDEKCRAEKPTRIRIAIKYTEILTMKGLTKREFINKQKWEAKSPTERELILQSLEKARKNIKNKASEVNLGK